ncbi:hypothetical protein SAMN04489724_0693 [Algoriphagus locisalis]|uniref:Uncharacterized protein n=1 Tax=Algoriphagus locisalis TaxID=305507 RepID=A0A1I6XVB9_9BACT|nr:hypothetical protein [Algoriphagus locisalis]SFT42369.1 hypothetical protein SAMN04489724_0693 [Algoriphagus locisalis]
MAKQAGYIKLEGTMGDLSFYKNRDGKFIARRKGGVSKKRILTDPKYQRTRENLAEFAAAASSAKFLKNAFREIEIKSNGGKLHNRLYSLAMKVVKSDPVSVRGERKFELGDMTMLRGFEFSEKATLENVLKIQPEKAEDEGSFTVTIPQIVPTTNLVYSDGTEFYRFSLIRAAVDFAQKTYKSETIGIEPLPINSLPTPAVSLTLPKPGIAGETYFFALALEFFLDVNETRYDSRDVSQNPAVILAVS